jgi:DsbC/DsbD-like thiol-disulfide interchange protein
MLTAIEQVRLLAAAGLVALGAHAASASQDASRWEGDARSAARLIAGTRSPGSGGALRAGIEIRLKPGWHTYWRYPGDAGVPPQFGSISGSSQTSSRSRFCGRRPSDCRRSAGSP